jgi:hypothetical protein
VIHRRVIRITACWRAQAQLLLGKHTCHFHQRYYLVMVEWGLLSALEAAVIARNQHQQHRLIKLLLF